MKILVVGGAGYIGAWLVPYLLTQEHHVTVYDSMMFGNGHLPDNENLTIIQANLQYTDQFKIACEGKDAVIYLASLSNNDACNADLLLSDEINITGFRNAVVAARSSSVQRFIYASSAAVYGSSNEEAVETEKLEPSTLYGHGKRFGEAWLLAHQQDNFTCVITRSASVCGYSPSMRFDTTINKMTHDAFRHGVITVNGGEQKRSHIHMKDLCRFYELLLNAPKEKIAGQAFNVVAENQTVMESAQLVTSIIPNTRIEVKPRSDDRSYSVSGKKAQEVLKFNTKWTVMDAVIDMHARFKDGYWEDSLTRWEYQRVRKN